MVYKITCNWCSSIFVDEISQHVATRILEHHKRDSLVRQRLVKYHGTARKFEWQVLNACRGFEKRIPIEAIFVKILELQLKTRWVAGRELKSKD